MKKIFVTTFNNRLFKKYAEELINSYVKTDQEIDLYCYVEDDVALYPKHKNIFYLNLYNEQPESFKFVERNKKKSQQGSEISYLLDAVRFSYKVFDNFYNLYNTNGIIVSNHQMIRSLNCALWLSE